MAVGDIWMQSSNPGVIYFEHDYSGGGVTYLENTGQQSYVSMDIGEIAFHSNYKRLIWRGPDGTYYYKDYDNSRSTSEPNGAIWYPTQTAAIAIAYAGERYNFVADDL